MGGFGAAKATLEPHGGEWLPRRGTGRGESNASLDAFPEPLGESFKCFGRFAYSSEKIIEKMSL